jgi:plastocyanin
MKNSWKYLGIILAGAFLAAGCGQKSDDDDLAAAINKSAGSAASSAVKGTAVLSGKVILNGKAPASAKIDMSADPICKAQHSTSVTDQTVLQNPDGTLQNVFIYVKSGAGNYPVPGTPVTLQQKGCMYNPHVIGVQAGQKFEILNSDATMHNVHFMAAINDAFNLGQPVQDMVSEKVFSKPEIMVPVKCDVHGWMHCYVGVVSNPFYNVTGTDGTFKISELPAGTYTLEAWHEKYGTSDQTVTIKDGETQTVNFTFSAK